MFHLNMPRVSVDIDLTYTPASKSRNADLDNIRASLKRIQERLIRQMPALRFSDSARAEEDLKLICEMPDATVKLEMNQINREIIGETGMCVLCDKAQDIFESTRELLIKTINESLTKEDKDFLLAFAKGEPDWTRVDYSSFPAIKWKLLNICKLKESNPQKLEEQVEALKEVLD